MTRSPANIPKSRPVLGFPFADGTDESLPWHHEQSDSVVSLGTFPGDGTKGLTLCGLPAHDLGAAPVAIRRSAELPASIDAEWAYLACTDQEI